MPSHKMSAGLRTLGGPPYAPQCISFDVTTAKSNASRDTIQVLSVTLFGILLSVERVEAQMDHRGMILPSGWLKSNGTRQALRSDAR